MSRKIKGANAKERKPNPRIGGSLDDFLEEEGLLDVCEAQAVKELLASDIQEAMLKEGLTKTAMARRMATSRPALDRLLNPENSSVTLHTLQRAAAALGKRLHVRISNP